MLKLYRAVIIPRITFACSAWLSPRGSKGEKTRYRKFISKLAALQKKTLCIYTGAYKNTASEVIEKETNSLPIKLLVKKLIASSTMRVTDSEVYRYSQPQRFRTRPSVDYPHHKRQSPLSKCQKWMKQVLGTTPEGGGFPQLERHTPMIKEPWYHPARTIIKGSPELAIQNHNEIIQHQANDHLIIYTDGSGINGHVAAAAWCATTNWMNLAYIGTEDQSNVYAAEVMGLVLTSELAIRKGNSVHHVPIFTNNQSAIDTIWNPGQQSGQYIIKRALERMRILHSKGILIDIHWIPALAGVEGNEKVDLLAKEPTGLRAKPVNRGPKAPVPFPIRTLQANVRRKITQSIYRRWREDWGEQDTGLDYKVRFGKTQDWTTIQQAYRGLSRAESSLATQLVRATLDSMCNYDGGS
ncbi:hypothetical protein K3495_g6475 [Podosphaera aphanis]|nr:hypothetical protein K3495_g6475 [Podosphaera aphanis]